jgi:hypothetical protein
MSKTNTHLEEIQATADFILSELGKDKSKWETMIRNEGSAHPDIILFRKAKATNRVLVNQPAVCHQWNGGIVTEDEVDTHYFVKEPLAGVNEAVEYTKHQQAQKAIIVTRLTEVLAKYDDHIKKVTQSDSDKSRVQFVNVIFGHTTGSDGEHLPLITLKRDRGLVSEEQRISNDEKSSKIAKPLAKDLLILHQELCSDGKSYFSARYRSQS